MEAVSAPLTTLSQELFEQYEAKRRAESSLTSAERDRQRAEKRIQELTETLMKSSAPEHGAHYVIVNEGKNVVIVARRGVDIVAVVK